MFRRAEDFSTFYVVLTSVPYAVLEMTSGAIQYGVPTRDFLFGTSLLI